MLDSRKLWWDIAEEWHHLLSFTFTGTKSWAHTDYLSIYECLSNYLSVITAYSLWWQSYVKHVCYHLSTSPPGLYTYTHKNGASHKSLCLYNLTFRKGRHLDAELACDKCTPTHTCVRRKLGDITQKNSSMQACTDSHMQPCSCLGMLYKPYIPVHTLALRIHETSRSEVDNAVTSKLHIKSIRADWLCLRYEADVWTLTLKTFHFDLGWQGSLLTKNWFKLWSIFI